MSHLCDFYNHTQFADKETEAWKGEIAHQEQVDVWEMGRPNIDLRQSSSTSLLSLLKQTACQDRVTALNIWGSKGSWEELGQSREALECDQAPGRASLSRI